MRLKKRVPSGRERDAAAIAKLEQLREKLYSENPSVARHSAFNLSWMQEDGYDILKEALFSAAPRSTKGAAAYGLRKMRGRMHKGALALIEEGAKDTNISTRQVCERALSLEKRRRYRQLSNHSIIISRIRSRNPEKDLNRSSEFPKYHTNRPERGPEAAGVILRLANRDLTGRRNT